MTSGLGAASLTPFTYSRRFRHIAHKEPYREPAVPNRLLTLATMTAAVAATGITGAQHAASASPGTALTIYSHATPGAISPEAYRQPSRGALPGYAVVRQE